MSSVLKLDVEAAATSMENITKDSIGSEGQSQSQSQSPSTLLLAREMWRSQEPITVTTDTITTTAGNAAVIASGDDAAAATKVGKSQLLQCLEATNNQEQQTVTTITASTLATVKPVVTYPVAKGAREQVQRIASSQTNTTEMLTTRVISQKLPPSSTDQAQAAVPVTLNISSQTSTNSTSSLSPNSSGVLYSWQANMTTMQSTQPIYQSKDQAAIADLIHCNKQQQITSASNVQAMLHHKLQPIYSMGTSTAAIKTMDLQRHHTKQLPSSITSTSQSAQKIKTVTNVITNPSTIVAQRSNSLSKSQKMSKTRVLPGQFINNQTTANNANSQKIQLGNSTMQKTTQPVDVTNVQKTTLQSVCNNQKIPILSNHLPNLKTQQQGLQKLQVPQKISLAVGRQQFQLNTQQMNNISKSNSLVTGTQKYVQSPGQHYMACQQTAIPQARSQTAIGLQKSQALTTVQTTKLQMTTSNVCKSNSVPNVSKSSQNILTIGKQQSHVQSTSAQLLQGSQQVVQKSQQSTNNTNNVQQVQRSHSITNVHSKVITSALNNQRTPVVINSKLQQQQQQQQQQQTVMRVGISKNQTQAAQTVAGLKAISQKSVVNPVKATVNSQNNVIQQSIVQRNNNNPPPFMKIVQQQQQNVIGPQNALQKQPGCIKTIPPQKSVQRNQGQKISSIGLKPLLSSNVTGFTKAQGSTATQVAPKTSIKTLLPQQTVVTSSSVIIPHKNSPIKIQQAIQQKQLVMTPQYTQQIRQQAGQIKTLLPITSATIEPRKDFTENKNNNELRMSKEEEQTTPKSPVRRMPLPYECLQFVLQDHNYGAPPPRTPPPPPSPPPHPKQQPINGAGSSTATSQHPYIFNPVVSNTNVEDDAASAISSEAGREAEPEGEETETAPEGEGDDEDSVTRCICDFEHDDGYMICCDQCLVWQHVDCMGIDRSNIPDEYLCERCRPRRMDRQRARALQMRKREELLNSDTSSDTSSTSSADTDVGTANNTTTQKKRSLSQQQPQVPRRNINKSDASGQSSQVRRLNNNNNNNNVGKRQRRDSQARQSSTVRKKENVTPKRGPGKRKIKRRPSLEDKEENVQNIWGPNMAPLRQWIEGYEEAVTNHYSPELRARISNIKVNGTHSDLRQSNMNVVATGKCRLNAHSNNLRFLVATIYLPPNTPVIELRGKYMLSTQHRLQYAQSGRQHVQRPGPFVFFYRLPRDGTEVCVDTRTYGNEARFVRRSCKPNAEVKHCIEKGTLHLYIVTTCAVEKNAEITIKHEQHDLLLSPNPNSLALPVTCACNNPRECQIANTASQLNRRGSNGALVENADGRERRRRGRRNTVCEETGDSTPATVPPLTSITQTVTTATSSAISSTITPATPKKTVTTTVTATTTRQVAKEDTTTATVTNVQPQASPGLNQPVATTPETKKDKKKMTREERKMEAIMKAFERLEKAEQRKQEVQARNAQRKESGGTHSDDDNQSMTGQSKNSKQTSSERPLRRRRRKGRARTTSSSQSQGSSRRTRLNSAESDVSSGDESNSMQSPPLLGQNRPPNQDVPYSSHLHTPSKSTTDDVNTGSPSVNQGIPTAAGLLLALANSNAPGPPSSPPLQQPTPVKSPTCDSGASSSSQSSTPSTPLSSACLLVAAAVGPLAPGFKFPKTKKVLMNEWLKESPDPSQVNIPQVSPLPAVPHADPLTLQNSMKSLCGRHFPSVSTDASTEFLSQSYGVKSLATLVQAANSVSGICDSPPQRRQQAGNNNGNGGCPAVSTGSAKKRWLRQAISEECDSPNSRPESPPLPSETVAPPKKRRIARESLSSENYTPPTTPTMLFPTEAAPSSRSLCSADDDYMEHAQSPIVEQTDERHESESVKKETKMDDTAIDCNKPREKLSIDIFPQSELYIKREEKPEECPDVVKVSSERLDTENDVIKEEKVSPKWEGDDTKSECNYDRLNRKIIERIREAVERVKSESFAKEEVVTKGTVEIIDQDEPDTEMEELSSPIATMEPDAILKQRVVEMQLEFGGGISEIVNIVSSESERTNDERKPSEVDAKRCQETVEKSTDDSASIDEFDVEAQMKKITGDDGNDYREKIDTSSERDKSMDGIEGLMESSREDSDSEDEDADDDKYCESSFKLFDISHEETPFKESDAKPDIKSEQIIVTEDDTKETDKGASDEPAKEIPKAGQSSAFTALSEESVFESAATNMDAESVADSPKIFRSIPPLSERIRKKTDPSSGTPKTPKMDFETAIIESTISMDAVDGSENGEQKSVLSTALRELLEAKLDDQPTGEVMKNDIDNEINASSQIVEPKSDSSEHSLDTVQDSASTREAPKSPEETPPAKGEETKSKEIKRLKDPRTVVPNSMPAPALKPDALPPVKRKLSISEYRKRKQQSSGGSGAEPESSNDTSVTDKSGARGRSDSASSGTSSLSSDEEGSKASLSLEVTGLNAATLFPNATNENDEKKGGEEGAIGWSAAPTLVERQRENLTERLKREFGLFLSDDEEERARKHGLTAEAILKAHKSSPPLVVSIPPGLSPQLPPQPYIPPPGSASIHYTQFQSKPGTVQYPVPNFAIPPPTTCQQSAYGTAAPSQTTAAGKQPQQTQFLVPQTSQAPPGSNPYPPQFVPPSPVPPPATGTAAPVSKFPPATPQPSQPPPPGTQVSPTSSGQPQKSFF